MKTILLACAGLLLAQTAWANPVEYKCEITRPDSHGWIPPEYYFQIDPDTGGAKVLSSYHDWTNAKLKSKNPETYRLLWNVTLRSSEGQTLRMKYQANLDLTKSSVRVRASFAHVGAANKPFGSGICHVYQG